MKKAKTQTSRQNFIWNLIGEKSLPNVLDDWQIKVVIEGLFVIEAMRKNGWSDETERAK